MTIGAGWLQYMGVEPDQYPDFYQVAAELDEAMWDAAVDVLDQQKRRDPILRVLADERCGLYQWCTVPAGTLPVGTEVRVTKTGRVGGTEQWSGRIRPADDREQRVHPDHVHAWWTLTYSPYSAGSHPFLDKDTPVLAWLPIPFDMSALLAAIEQETGEPSPIPVAVEPPPPPITWDDLTEGRIIHYRRAVRGNPWHHTPARRPAGQLPVIRRARIDFPLRHSKQLRVTVLNKNGTENRLFGGVFVGFTDVVHVEPAANRQVRTELNDTEE